MKETGGIAIVGPCASGKSSLAARLKEAGWQARQIAQEHSYVPSMWQQLSQPDYLIFLDAAYETCTARKELNWTRQEYSAQMRRLAHAKEHSDLYLETDNMTEEQVFNAVIARISGGQSTDQSL